MSNPSATRTRTRAATPARELSWSFILLVILCACIVAAGFFFAARQHFTAMEYSIKNSKLRDQLQNLESEKRRLELAREVALSPSSIGRAARGLGLRETTTEPTQIVASAKPEQEKSMTPKAEAVKAPVAKMSSTSTVVKTVMTQPAAPAPTGETRSRVVDTKKEKKEGSAVAAILKLR